jgi:L,D-peptidoglycan transpeptidase YkuD (ErfK/YbiS/YcfS/YnhG family)
MSLLGVACSGNAVKPDRSGWSDARQLVLVTTADWDANSGSLRTFEMTAQGWQPVADPIPVTIGRTGSAWGVGLHEAQPGPIKKEGDGRAPAGVFRVGSAFGYAESAPTAMPYLAMDESDYCVDVDGSPLYNRIVDAREVGAAAVAQSTEPMRRDIHANGDQRYKLGLVIEHNPQGRPGAGSCIFAHLWKAPGETTAGCTAMDEPAMRRLYAWLRPERHPVFILLPMGEYRRLKSVWNLPDVDPN